MFDPVAALPDAVRSRIDDIRADRSSVIALSHSGTRAFSEIVSEANRLSYGSSVLLLKVIEVHPASGKVAARRTLDLIGRDYFSTIGDLSDDDIHVVEKSLTETHG